MSISAATLGVSVYPKLERLGSLSPIKKKQTTFYDEWASSYDWDLLDMGYKLHVISSMLLLENMENSKEEDCFVIDIGCGTGFVGTALRRKGFKGIMHAVDDNETVLDIADRKRVYDDLFIQHIAPREKLHTADNLRYDGLTCVSALGKNHIDPRCLPDMINHVKTNGVVVFTLANHPRETEDKDIIEEELKALVEKKSVRKVSETEEFYFQQGRRSRSTEMVATCTLYCYVKL